MKPLAQTFDGKGPKKGFKFTLLDRNDRIALYQKQKTNGSPTWEVIRIQKNKLRVIAGKTFEPSESFPSPVYWGREGWTCQTEQDARQKFKEWSNL